MYRPLAAVCAFALFFVLPRSGFAQATATITGTVRDSSGAVVPGAKIIATNENTNLTRSSLADDAGQYVIPLLPSAPIASALKKRVSLPLCKPASACRRIPRCRWTR